MRDKTGRPGITVLGVEKALADSVRVPAGSLLGGLGLNRMGLEGLGLVDLRLPSDLVESWRTDLEDANRRILRQVSGSMAEVIANQSIARIPDWAALSPGIESLGRGVAEQLTPYLTESTRQLQADLQRWIKPAALAAATDFSARLKGTSDEFRRYQRALQDQGWWMPPSVPMHVFWEVGQLADAGKKTKLRQRMVQLGTSRFARHMVDGWMDLDVFHNRRRFVMDGLKDLRDGRWRVAIPTLLPLIEGITVEVFEPGSSRGPKAVLARVPGLSLITADALVETVGILFDKTDFATTPADSPLLNRHFVLHGRSTGYGRGENAVKVLFALDQLASTVRRAANKP